MTFGRLEMKQVAGVWHLAKTVAPNPDHLTKCAIDECECIEDDHTIGTMPTLTVEVGGTTTARAVNKFGETCSAPSSCPAHATSYDMPCNTSQHPYQQLINQVAVCAFSSAPIIYYDYYIDVLLEYSAALQGAVRIEIETGFRRRASGGPTTGYFPVQRFIDIYQFVPSRGSRCSDPLPSGVRTWSLGESETENCCTINDVTTSISLA